jgi:hypothetical protein
MRHEGHEIMGYLFTLDNSEVALMSCIERGLVPDFGLSRFDRISFRRYMHSRLRLLIRIPLL